LLAAVDSAMKVWDVAEARGNEVVVVRSSERMEPEIVEIIVYWFGGGAGPSPLEFIFCSLKPHR